MIYAVGLAGLLCLVIGASLITPAAGLIVLGVALLAIYLTLVNRPEGVQ